MIQTIQQPGGDGDDVHLFRILQGLFYHGTVAEKRKFRSLIILHCT